MSGNVGKALLRNPVKNRFLIDCHLFHFSAGSKTDPHSGSLGKLFHKRT